MLQSKSQLYNYLFYKSFFFDKYFVTNVYQCPKINHLKVKLFSASQLSLNKAKFCKLITFFYLLTGQQPKLLVQQCTTLRNSRNRKIAGSLWTLHKYNHFLNFLMYRQISFSSLTHKVVPLNYKKVLTFEITHKVQDDDILLQALKLTDLVKYQVTITSSSLLKTHFYSLLRVFKFPYKNNL